MTYPTQSYAAFSPTTPLAPHSFERRELRADDVLIDIMYCGVYHSDLHTARNDWGFTHTLIRLWSDTKSSDALPKSATTPKNLR